MLSSDVVPEAEALEGGRAETRLKGQLSLRQDSLFRKDFRNSSPTPAKINALYNFPESFFPLCASVSSAS